MINIGDKILKNNEQNELKSKILRAAYLYDMRNYKESNALAKSIITSECENVNKNNFSMKIIARLWLFIFCQGWPKSINMRIYLARLWNKKTCLLFKKMYRSGRI